MKSIKEKANYFLYNCGLLKELQKYGKTDIIGSYRMDMMAWNDLDIYIENTNMSLDKLYELSTFIIKNFQPTWYEAKEEIWDGKKVWFQGFETMMTGELWNFDIWFFDKDKIDNTIRYCDMIAAKATNRQKEIIVEIKKALIDMNLYSFEKYRSVDVYKAVTEMNITGINEFLSKYNIDKYRD